MIEFKKINWEFTFKEAKARRKGLKMSQKKLAMMIGISTPTLSDFENGSTTIKVSSFLKIISMLGMLDKTPFDPKPTIKKCSECDQEVENYEDLEEWRDY